MVPCFRACSRSLRVRTGMATLSEARPLGRAPSLNGALADARASDARHLGIDSLPFLHAKSINERRHDRFSEAARDALYRRVFFVEKVARVVGELELAAKDKILIVVKHAVLVLVAHSHCRRDRHFKNAGAAFVIKQ